VVDRTYSWVRFHKDNIWFTSANEGFWIGKHKPQTYTRITAPSRSIKALSRNGIIKNPIVVSGS
jgi:hypothetical protein